MWTPEDRALVGDFGSGQALSDDQYRRIKPFLPPAKPGGRPRTTDMRRLLDGLFYVVRTGCQWRHVPPPPAFPPWQTIYGYFRAFLTARFESQGAGRRFRFGCTRRWSIRRIMAGVTIASETSGSSS